MGFKVTTDIKELESKIKKTQQSIPRGLEKIADDARDEIVSHFPKDSGKTAADFEVKANSDLSFEITNPNPAALYVYTGRGEVTPKNAKALHFFIDGKEVFTKRSEGTEPNDYITPALNNVANRVDQLADEVVDNG